MRGVGTRIVQRVSPSEILPQVRIFTLWYWACHLNLVILSEISTLDLQIPLEGEGMKTIPHCWRASVSVFGCAVKIRDKAVCRLMRAESLVTCAPSIVRLSVCSWDRVGVTWRSRWKIWTRWLETHRLFARVSSLEYLPHSWRHLGDLLAGRDISSESQNCEHYRQLSAGVALFVCWSSQG